MGREVGGLTKVSRTRTLKADFQSKRSTYHEDNHNNPRADQPRRTKSPGGDSARDPQNLKLREGDVVAFAEQKNGVLMKPKRVVDPDGVLTAKESALVKKAEREMRQGKYVTLDQLRHDLDSSRSRRSRKTA